MPIALLTAAAFAASVVTCFAPEESCAGSVPRSIRSTILRLHRVSHWERSLAARRTICRRSGTDGLVDALRLFEANQATMQYLGRA